MIIRGRSANVSIHLDVCVLETADECTSIYFYLYSIKATADHIFTPQNQVNGDWNKIVSNKKDQNQIDGQGADR